MTEEALDGLTGRGLYRAAGLAAAGAALVCWGLALGGSWPVAFALYRQRALPGAGATLAPGVVLAVAGGALLTAALEAALRATRGGRRTEPTEAAGRSCGRGPS